MRLSGLGLCDPSDLLLEYTFKRRHTAGIFGVAQFNGIIEIYPRPTLVAKVTKMSELEQTSSSKILNLVLELRRYLS